MVASRLASVAAILVGVVWLASALLGGGGSPLHEGYLVGLGLLVLCLAAVGYSLVATAPIWLRVVVALATPALGTMVWISVVDALSGGSRVVLLAGLVLLVAGLAGLVRLRRAAAPGAHPGPAHGRRAAR